MENLDIFKVINTLGLKGKVEGSNFITNCPIPGHEDTSPSFSLCIDGPKSGLWQCWSCGEKGNLIILLEKALKISREEAILRFHSIYGLGKQKLLPPTIEDIRARIEIKKEVLSGPKIFNLPRLSQSQEPIIKHLMQKRDYTQALAEQVIKTFNLGWCDVGYYKSRIIIPIVNQENKEVGFEASAIDKIKNKKLYPKSMDKSHYLFNYYQCNNQDVWLVEGIFDAIKLHTFGVDVVASFGSSLSRIQASLLIKKYEKVILFYDGDNAGKNGAKKAVSMLAPYIDILEMPLLYGDPDNLSYGDFQGILNMKREADYGISRQIISV